MSQVSDGDVLAVIAEDLGVSPGLCQIGSRGGSVAVFYTTAEGERSACAVGSHYWFECVAKAEARLLFVRLMRKQ